jgi:hypothetical protein
MMGSNFVNKLLPKVRMMGSKFVNGNLFQLIVMMMGSNPTDALYENFWVVINHATCNFRWISVIASVMKALPVPKVMQSMMKTLFLSKI